MINKLSAEVCGVAKKLVAEEVKKVGYKNLTEIENPLLKELIEKLNALDNFLENKN